MDMKISERLMKETLKNIRSVLDKGIKVTPETGICTLDLDGSQYLEILSKCNIPYQNYISGGRITEKGISRLKGLALEVTKQPGDHVHFAELSACQTTKELIGKMRAEDIAYMKQYERMFPE